MIILSLVCFREGDEVQRAVRATGNLLFPCKDDFGAFMSFFRLLPPENLSASATLAGLTFAVKDMLESAPPTSDCFAVRW